MVIFHSCHSYVSLPEGKLYIQQSTKISRTEEYLHRVGRTARIGKSGSALLFLQPSELGFSGRFARPRADGSERDAVGGADGAGDLAFSVWKWGNVNPGLINHSHNLINGTLPMKQPRGLLIQGWHYSKSIGFTWSILSSCILSWLNDGQ